MTATSTQLIEQHTNEDGDTNLAAVIADMQEFIGNNAHVVTPDVTLAVLQMHMQTAFAFIGRQVLSALDQLGALPLPLEDEIENLMQGLRFDFWRHLYDAVSQISQQSKLFVPDGKPDLEVVRS